MKIETEIKIHCANFSEIERKLIKAGLILTQIKKRHFEDNWLLDTVNADLYKHQAALRLRLAADQVILTYKGLPKKEQTSSDLKSREEIEVLVNDADLTLLMFKRLGYHQVFRYQKFRTIYKVAFSSFSLELLAMFDETPIGNFLELEGNPDVLKKVIELLNLPNEVLCIDTYIGLQKKHCDALGLPLKDLVFTNTN